VRFKSTTTLHEAGENSDKQRLVAVGVEEQSRDSSRSIAVSDPETDVGAKSKGPSTLVYVCQMIGGCVLEANEVVVDSLVHPPHTA
jgi:hypothetical protein